MAFVVRKEDISTNKYDLSINRYKKIEYKDVVYDLPLVILNQLGALEKEIYEDLTELREML